MAKERVYVLDDDPNRHSMLDDRLSAQMSEPHQRFFDAESIIKQLTEDIESGIMVDTVFLDHDLGGEVFVESEREDCGMEVVRFIVENKPEIRQIVVHTMNGVAGIEMRNKLMDAGYKNTDYVAFHILCKSLEAFNEDHYTPYGMV